MRKRKAIKALYRERDRLVDEMERTPTRDTAKLYFLKGHIYGVINALDLLEGE